MLKISRKMAAVLVAGALLLGGVSADARSPKLTPEEKLAKALEGRVAGKPVDCIYMPSVQSSRIYDKTAIVYESGRTLYVNRPDSGARWLDDDDILVTELRSSQLCQIDIVRLHDRSAPFYRGWVGLGKFVPYTKPAKVAKAN